VRLIARLVGPGWLVRLGLLVSVAGMEAALAGSVIPTVYQDGSYVNDLSTEGTTGFVLGFGLLDDRPVTVDVYPTTTTLDEVFFAYFYKQTGTMTDLTIRWEKDGPLITALAPTEQYWYAPGVFLDRGEVASATVTSGESFYQVFLTFNQEVQWGRFDFLVWPAFNYPFATFSITFDPNGVEVGHAPIPAAALLMASALIGLGVYRARRRTA